MDTGTPLGDEARDWGIGVIGFQQLYQGLPRAEPDYVRAVGIVQRDLGQPQHIPEERQALGEGPTAIPMWDTRVPRGVDGVIKFMYKRAAVCISLYRERTASVLAQN